MADTCQTLCTRHCTRHCTMYCILYSSWLDIFQTLHSTVRCAVNWTDPVYSTSLCFDFCNKNPKTGTTSTHRAVLNRRGLCKTHCVWLNRSGLCIAGLTVAKHEHEADASYGGEVVIEKTGDGETFLSFSSFHNLMCQFSYCYGADARKFFTTANVNRGYKMVKALYNSHQQLSRTLHH